MNEDNSIDALKKQLDLAIKKLFDILYSRHK